MTNPLPMSDMDVIRDLDSNNILVASGASTDPPQGLYRALVRVESAPSLIGVTLTGTPDDWLEKTEQRLGSLPPQIVLITVGDHARSASASVSIDCERSGTNVSIRPVKSPKNLTRLGVELTNAFTHTRSGDSGPVSMCFDDLSSLLMYTDEESTFRFFSVLTDHVRTEGVRAHYHLNTDAVSDKTYHVIRMAFDSTVTLLENGEVSIDRSVGG